MKKFWILLLFMLIVLCTLSGCGRKISSYYAFAVIDDNYSITGKFPVAKNRAIKTECYHFFTDDNGNLVKVEHLYGGTLWKYSIFGEEVAQIKIEYSDGYEKRTYLNVNGEPVANREGIYYHRLKLDENGKPVSLSNFDKEDNLKVDEDSVAQYIATLNKQGEKIKEIYLDEKGKRIYTKNGIYEVRYKYDNKGNKTEERYYNEEGKLKEDNWWGSAILRWEYDSHGNPIERRHYDIEDRLKENKDGVAIMRFKYNKQGRIIESRRYSANDKLTEGKYWGCAIWRSKYDKHGNHIEDRCYGANRQLKDNKIDGCAISKRKYDDYGNWIEYSYHDVDGELKEDKSGIAIIRWEHNEKGILIKTIYLNKNREIIKEE